MSVLSVRLDETIDEQLQFVMSKLKQQDKSALVRQLLANSLKEKIIDITCDEVKSGNMSAWKAANLSKISLYQMLEELYKRNIEIYDEKAFLEDFELMRKRHAEDS